MGDVGDVGDVQMAYADLAAAVLAQPPRLGRSRLVTVDGAAGSGKTTFADRLVDALGDAGTVVHLDDLYAGWGDLEGCWSRVEEWVLGPVSMGRPGRIRRYDWYVGRFADAWHVVPDLPVVVVEGVSSGRRAVAGRSTLAVWVDAPEDLRLRRGLERDGEAVRAQWLQWVADEREHFTRECTRRRADLVVDGGAAPAVPTDGFCVIEDRRSARS